ncbi:MAG TPA: hypothetical protein DCY13_09090 [Verrucomicrobiales bacterium]|nr:hypothetical protein [Verrucomicrobiales bacterium]
MDEIDRRVREEFQRTNPYRMMARALFPAIGKSVLMIANAQTAFHLATVGCAVERYRLAEGRYPEDLDALVARYLMAIPNDVDGQPLRYRLEPDGSFVLYFIGTDLKDDGGAPTPSSPGDWVWKYPAGPEK